MKTTKLVATATLAILGLGAVVMLVAGCQNQGGTHSHAQGATMPMAQQNIPGLKLTKGGAELWTQNCLPCHNVRSPSAYSDADWDIVMQHMRVRANLAASDAETIAKFLKSAN